MLNSVSVVGRLVVDPELKTTTGGTKFVKGRVAVQRDFPKNNGATNASGYKDYDSDFIPFAIWGNQADFAATLIKGQMVGLTGRWQTSQYTDPQNNKQTGHELNVDHYYVLDKKNQDNSNNAPAPTNTPINQNNGFGNNGGNGFGQAQNGFQPQQPQQQGFYQQPQQQQYQPQAGNGFQPNAFNQPTNFSQ
jgi:single-strand DNA-binding protein